MHDTVKIENWIIQPPENQITYYQLDKSLKLWCGRANQNTARLVAANSFFLLTFLYQKVTIVNWQKLLSTYIFY